MKEILYIWLCFCCHSVGYTGYVQLLFNWPSTKIWSSEDFLCDQANQCIGSQFLSCRIIPDHKQLQGAEALFSSVSSWSSINSAFEMTVREVFTLLLCQHPLQRLQCLVQNSISYHLTGCSWILFPIQQGSNMVPDLYFVGIRYELQVPALLLAPARDGWTSGVGSWDQSMLTSLAELGTLQPGSHPAGLKQGRSGDRTWIQSRPDIMQGSVNRSDKYMVIRLISCEARANIKEVLLKSLVHWICFYQQRDIFPSYRKSIDHLSLFCYGEGSRNGRREARWSLWGASISHFPDSWRSNQPMKAGVRIGIPPLSLFTFHMPPTKEFL